MAVHLLCEQTTALCTQLVARIETQLRLRDGWLAEIEVVQSNKLLDQVRGSGGGRYGDWVSPDRLEALGAGEGGDRLGE